MKIALPDQTGKPTDYTLVGKPLAEGRLAGPPARVAYAAAHVVADPFAGDDPSGAVAVDWEATMRFRHHLHGLGLGIAEAMDTAQRGMGLGWNGALELIRRTRSELPDALIANGCGTDHLEQAEAASLDDVKRAYMDQLGAIQALDGRVILMASRAMARLASKPEDYIQLYGELLSACDRPAIVHWLGDMFDPALAGYWGGHDFESALQAVVAIIEANADRVDGIKLSLLDKDKEITLRRRLPKGVRMYTGDDFNYPELIQGDDQGYSHALLGIFDPLAQAAALAVDRLGQGDVAGFRATLDPTVPLARSIFKSPTRYYKNRRGLPGLAERISRSFRDARRRAGNASAALFRRDFFVWPMGAAHCATPISPSRG